jgi:hypothetical protein
MSCVFHSGGLFGHWSFFEQFAETGLAQRVQAAVYLPTFARISFRKGNAAPDCGAGLRHQRDHRYRDGGRYRAHRAVVTVAPNPVSPLQSGGVHIRPHMAQMRSAATSNLSPLLGS